VVNSDPDCANARAAKVKRTKMPVTQKNLDVFTALLLSIQCPMQYASFILTDTAKKYRLLPILAMNLPVLFN
jgi:hypothetical protein